jgi:GNAT superfamily N-acetyltransferase
MEGFSEIPVTLKLSLKTATSTSRRDLCDSLKERPIEVTSPLTTILQLSRTLVERPSTPAVADVQLRHYQGPNDIPIWLELRRRAFTRQKGGVGNWDASDFEREFLHKSWWQPEAMWFAEAHSSLLPPTPVGTVTLARRGDPPANKPVVHWLAVLPSFRRRRIGRLLMAALETAVWDAGGRQVWLETHSQWDEAVRLYEALGYKSVNR